MIKCEYTTNKMTKSYHHRNLHSLFKTDLRVTFNQRLNLLNQQNLLRPSQLHSFRQNSIIIFNLCSITTFVVDYEVVLLCTGSEKQSKNEIVDEIHTHSHTQTQTMYNITTVAAVKGNKDESNYLHLAKNIAEILLLTLFRPSAMRKPCVCVYMRLYKQ